MGKCHSFQLARRQNNDNNKSNNTNNSISDKNNKSNYVQYKKNQHQHQNSPLDTCDTSNNQGPNDADFILSSVYRKGS